MIPFNIPPHVGTENEYIKQAIAAHKICGDGEFAKQANIDLMAVELEAGYHDIELKYWLPGLTAGIIMSLVGVIMVCGIVIYNRGIKNAGKTN